MTKPKVEAAHGLGFYQRLFARGHTILLSKTTTDGDLRGTVRQRTEINDPDIALAYDLLIKMRSALQLCERQFRFYGVQQEGCLSGHLSLVERQNLESDIARNLGIADNLGELIDSTPALPAEDWRDIKTAPQDGSYIRALGKRDSGEVYVETTRWTSIKWGIEMMNGYLPPTHWLPMERLPDGY